MRKLCSQLAPFTSEESQATEHRGSSHAFAEAAHRLWSWESQTELIEEHGGVSLTFPASSIILMPEADACLADSSAGNEDSLFAYDSDHIDV